MPNEQIKVYGHTYVTDSALLFGDYIGAGTVGRANINFILAERPGDILECYFSELDYASRNSDRCTILANLDLFDMCKAGKPPLILHATGSYGSEQIFILAESEYAEETLAALADYPLLCDDTESKVRMEWERQAWDSWLESELKQAIGWGDTRSDEWDDKYDALEESERFACLYEAMESVNEYFEYETAGAWVSVPRISAAYAQAIEKRIGTE